MRSARARAACYRALTLFSALAALELRAGKVSFFGRRDYAVRREPSSIAIADFDGDGIPDVAVASWGPYPSYQDSGISVPLGQGDGTFQPARSFEVGRRPRALDQRRFQRRRELGPGHDHHPR